MKKSLPILVAMTVCACLLKLLLDGVVIQGITFGHVDASVYLAILSPILGSHSYLETKKVTNDNQS